MKAALTIATAIIASLALTVPADANGAKKKKTYRSAPPVARTYQPVRVVRVYEPRPAPPLVALSLAGSNLIIWDDLDVDLFDDGDPLPPRLLRMRAPDQRVRFQTYDRYSRRKAQGY
jgi:hypothetical protein